VSPDAVAGAIAGVARSRPAGAIVALLERLAPWRPGVLAVLTYHRVDLPESRPDLLPWLISATPDDFASQMADLVRHYAPVSMAQVLDALDAPRRLPPRAVLVTFDDAYADFDRHAWPILRAAGVPATLFVPTAFPDGAIRGFWWDRLWAALSATTLRELPDPPRAALRLDGPDGRRAAMVVLRDRIKGMPHAEAMAEVERLIAGLGVPPALDAPSVLGWDDLRRLAADGVTVAAHTRTHPLLDRVSLETAVEEIVGAHKDVEREIGSSPAVLAYPSGAHGGEAVEAARRSGMVLAVTTERGGNDLRHIDPLRIRRINVGRRARSSLVRTQLVWASVVDARRR
jgi:peptidoglycan/xylan/chitin deacetylase (PgdA/CDA1 family)